MKVGILEAEQLLPEILAEYGSYAEMTMELLRSVDDRISFQTYQVTRSEYPQTSDECDAFLITGSKASAYDNEAWITQLSDYIKRLANEEKKLIGICFGHQLIAQALGGKVEKSDKGWGVGVMESKVVLTQTWMQPAQQPFSLLVSHQDQVIDLPPKAERIAGSEFCINSSYQVGKHILTFQGHPEFSIAYARQSMDRRRELIGEARYLAAKASLDSNIDHNIIARWILNFINE